MRAADENILNSARSTHFMTPKSEAERTFRAAALRLAATEPFARRFVNSGRLSLPASLAGLSLQTPAEDGAGVAPGRVCPDAPVTGSGGQAGFLLDRLGGDFCWLAVGDIAVPPSRERLVRVGGGGLGDPGGLVAARYGVDFLYLIRPDQHVAARLRSPTVATMADALARACGVTRRSDERAA